MALRELPPEDRQALKAESKVLLSEAASRCYQACQKLERCNMRRFDQTVFRKELVSIERKLTKMQLQLDDLDL